MKTKIILVAVLVCLVSVFALSRQSYSEDKSLMMEEGMMQKGSMMAMEEAEETMKAVEPVEAKAIKVGNTICPVSLQKVGGDMGSVVEYEYKGKIYNLCCVMCRKDFEKDPEKYIKIIDELEGSKKTE